MNSRSGWLVCIARWVPITLLLSFILNLSALLCVVGGLVNVLPDLDPTTLSTVVIAGVCLTCLLCASHAPGWLAGLCLPAFGVAGVWLNTGRLWNALALFLSETIRLAWKTTLSRLSTGYPPIPGEVNRLAYSLVKLTEGIHGLSARLFDWLGQIIHSQPAFDPVATALIWSLAFWLVAAWATWLLFCYNRVLLGLLPAGALLAINLDYTLAGPGYFILFLGLVVLLHALHSYQARLRAWKSIRLELGDVWIETGLAILILIAILMLAAALTPALSIKEVASAAQQVFSGQADPEQRLADSLGLHSQPGATYTLENAHVGGLPNIRLLGSGPELSKRVVMYVTVQGYNPLPLVDLEGQVPSLPPRYYWRSLTYDLYSGRGWYTQSTRNVTYPGGEPLPNESISANRQNHQAVRQTVRSVEDLAGLIYVTGELTVAYSDYLITWRGPADAFGAQTGTSSYIADSLVPQVTEEVLRQTGTVYPPWIKDRYLYLPDNLPTRLQELAVNLTVTEPTPYDRAKAIESYLRKIPYTLNLSDPPPGVDVVDYFLFELKRGYCDYFASSMVVLSRLSGLPARFVTGYASGSFDVPNGRFTVTEADAHAWAEVYFPGVGWLEFEPTSSRPLIQRPGQDEQTAIVDLPPLEQLSHQTNTTSPSRKGLHLAFIVLFTCALFGIGWLIFDSLRLSWAPPSTTMAHIYRRLYRKVSRLVGRFRMPTTPLELQALLADRLANLATWRLVEPLANLTIKESGYLTQLYIKLVYSTQPITQKEKTSTIDTWRWLNTHLWLVKPVLVTHDLWKNIITNLQRPPAYNPNPPE